MDRPCAQVPAIVSELDSMSRELRGGRRVAQRHMEEALERGFGELMQLEAELQRRQRSRPPSEPQEGPDLVALRRAISELQEALNQLRTLSSPAEAPRIGYGFVLPAASPGEAPRSRD
jgi:hypothetical protein